ncbi:MAG: hypothetical protein AB8G17_13405 [Gammaproteobacteria bacterium]
MKDNKMKGELSAAQIAQLANAKPQGKRPGYFTDPMTEQSYAICMALMAELAAARERIDTLERLLVSKGALGVDDVNQYVPDAAAGEERQRAQVEYCARVLRPLQQQVEAMAAQHDPSMDELAEHLGATPGLKAGDD